MKNKFKIVTSVCLFILCNNSYGLSILDLEGMNLGNAVGLTPSGQHKLCYVHDVNGNFHPFALFNVGDKCDIDKVDQNFMFDFILNKALMGITIESNSTLKMHIAGDPNCYQDQEISPGGYPRPNT